MSKYEDRPYRVGKGKPPAEHQWPKGKSGNPRGAPRKRKRHKVLWDLAIEIANQEIELTLGGKVVSLPKKDAILLAMTTTMCGRLVG